MSGAFIMQMNVSVTPELYELVQRKVNSGLYGNASEVVRDALRRMDERVIVETAWDDLNDTLEVSAASGQSPNSIKDIISRTLRGSDE
ncbi:MAG: type II toxin-antitoxin system ParD family antitoxin [Pseudomonadota bacterium]|nr:type II toxin-antitoxin system ParD family antitoxin [Pseudomonadota bacterium]